MTVGCLHNDEIISTGFRMDKEEVLFYSKNGYELMVYCFEEMPTHLNILEDGGDIILIGKELEMFIHKFGRFIKSLFLRYDEQVSHQHRGYMKNLFGREYYIAVRGVIVDREIDSWYSSYEQCLVALQNNLPLYFIQKPYYSLNTFISKYAGYIVLSIQSNLNEKYRISIDDLLSKTDWWMMKNNLPLLDREKLEEVIQLLLDLGYVAREEDEVFFTEKGIVAYFRYPPWVTPPPEEPYDPNAFDPEWG